MHLAAVDLNLLVVLDALIAEGHVTRAARRVGLSQSATSHALARLRILLEDPLFVRAGRGLQPTPRLMALREPVRAALVAAEVALLGPPRFDARSAHRVFRIGAGELVELALLPSLAAHVARDAPHVELAFHPPGTPGAHGPLARGELDLVLGPARQLERSAVMPEEMLFDEGFVCMMRRGHPLAARRKLTLDAYCAAAHAVVDAPGDVVDDELARLGRARRVALRVPDFMVAPFILAESDLVLTLPERVARTFAQDLPVVLVAPPLVVPGFTIAMQWHERTTDDPAHVWLRKAVARTAARVAAPLSDAATLAGARRAAPRVPISGPASGPVSSRTGPVSGPASSGHGRRITAMPRS